VKSGGVDQPLTDYLAASCILYPCIKRYNAEVIRGTLTEAVDSTEPANAFTRPYYEGIFSRDFAAIKSPCTVGGRRYDFGSNMTGISSTPGSVLEQVEYLGSNYSMPSECVYRMDSAYVLSLFAFLNNTLFAGTSRFEAY
jgi:hypothetical protein